MINVTTILLVVLILAPVQGQDDRDEICEPGNPDSPRFGCACCLAEGDTFGICCLHINPADRLHKERWCTSNLECVCADTHWGKYCKNPDECLPKGAYYKRPGNDLTCGDHGECVTEGSYSNRGPGIEDALICTCDAGWSDDLKPEIFADPIYGKCRIEDPCLSDNKYCNRVECDACQCDVPDHDRTGLHPILVEGRRELRKKHTCSCADGFYSGIDNADDYQSETCFRRKCKDGPGVKPGGCKEHDGGEPVYDPCVDGYTGDTCDLANYCVINDYDAECRRAGDAKARCAGPIRKEEDLKCQCGTAGYSGNNCEIRNYCVTDYGSDRNYCGRFGKCDSQKSDSNEQVCECEIGYVGKRCVKNGCDLGPNLCVHGLDKMCIPNYEMANDYFCGTSTDDAPSCETGWYGGRCNIENPCETQKACNSDAGNCEECCVVDLANKRPNGPIFEAYVFQCDCTKDVAERFEGNHCEVLHKCNDAKNRNHPVGRCSDHGECKFTRNTDAECACHEGFFGEFCERVDFCFETAASDPCNTNEDSRNSCDRLRTRDPADVFCHCAPGFNAASNSPTGKRCVRDPCFQVTCSNGGTPLPTPDATCQCACPHGRHGADCEFVDRCVTTTNPCNDFACTPNGNTVTCDCPQDLYTATCQIIDMCQNDPGICDLDAVADMSQIINTCVKGTAPGEFSCLCADGWIADPKQSVANCFVKDACNHPDTRCNAAGTEQCIDGPKPTCVCKEDEFYVGDRCETQDVCSGTVRSPFCSQLGTATCVELTSITASCQCHPGFHGARCEFQDRCTNGPCQNGGVCQPVENSYTCACPDLYRTPGGTDCQFENGCVRDQPCQNGFPCTPNPSVPAPNDWTCHCGPEFLAKMDCSERDPCVNGNRCRNGGKCTRVDDKTSACDCSAIPEFFGDFCHIEKASILLDAYPSTANVGEQRLFILIVKKRGSDPTFKIDFGDSFNFEISARNLLPLNFDTIQDQRGILDEEGIALLRPFANEGYEFFPFTHIYNTEATYKVTTAVSNGGLLAEQFTNDVIASTVRCLPLVALQNCGRSRTGRQDPKVPTYERKSRFVIEASLYYPQCTPESDIKFKWNLFRLTAVSPYPRIDNEWELGGITTRENDDPKHIIFLPYNLLQGEYWIQLFVYFESEKGLEQKKPIGNLDWCYFNLKNSPPIARIEGGNARTIHFHAAGNEPLVLNASSSIDQNDPGDPKLTFEWNYRVDDDMTSYPCSLLSKSSCTASWIEIDVLNLDISKRYAFHVDVESIRHNEMSTAATARQEISIVDEGLEVIVQCIENCFKFNPGDTVHIECGCRDCTEDAITFDHGWDSKFGSVKKIGPKTFHLTLSPAPLEDHVLEFTCTGSISSGGHLHEGKSAFPIVINKPPLPGTCSLDAPSRVTFLQQLGHELHVNCQDFTDPEPSSLPLTYQVNAIITQNGVIDEILPNGVLLLHDVFERLHIAYLPMGEPPTTYAIMLQVEVSDAFGLPAETKQSMSIEVAPPAFDSLNLATTQAEFRMRLDVNFGVVLPEGDSILSKLMNAGDNQKALQLILSVLYTLRTYSSPPDSDLNNIMATVGFDERHIVSHRIMTAIRQIPLYSHLIVKQVMQSLYLLSYYAEYLPNETLLSCAEQLIQTAKYFRNFVLQNEEVIYTEDIAQLAMAGKSAAENIMVETEKRGRDLLDKDAALAKKKQEVELQYLYQKDRDYFLEVDELTSVDENISVDQPEGTSLDPEQVEVVKRMSSICQRAFVSIIHLLEAIASREVISTTSQIRLPAISNSKVTSSVDIFPVEDLRTETRSGIKFPEEIVTLIQKQNSKAVQLHYSVSEINPFFGDFGIKPDTNIFRVEMKVDGFVNDGSDQWIRISETEEPILIRIPFKSTSQKILDVTIDAEKSGTAESEFATVELVPFYEISDLNPNIKLYHLHLIPGSSFYMVVTTRSEPVDDYKQIEYQAALTQDYRPTADDFCRQDTEHTRRFVSGDVIKFHIHEEAVAENAEKDAGDYLDYYLGIWPFDETEQHHPFGTKLQFSVNFVQLSCLTRNEDENQWLGRGCEVSDFVDGDYLECKCHHLSIFAGSVVVPPNKIDFSNTVQLFLTIPDNYIVTVVVCTILGVWLIGHLICYWKDRDDRRHHSGITIMCEIGENFSHSFYLVRIVTGSRISAGTTANVSLQIYGEHGRSKVYVVKDPTLSVLNRGGNDSFLISSTKDLGQLEKIRVWHDNSGPRPGWYLRKIIIREVKTGQRWYFFADTWLSMTYEKDPNIIREFTAATKQELGSWKRRFNDRIVEEFNNSHLWFSLFFRLPSSNFTRCQRWACSIGILVSHMLFNIMWEGIPTTDYSTLFEVGDFSINLRQVLLGLQIAVITSPVGIVLILLFRRIRRHRIPTLVVWQDRVKRHDILPNVREEHIFLPNKDGEFKETVIPASVDGGGDTGEMPRAFAVPSTDMIALEGWISTDTRGHGLRPPTQREPDAFVHRIEDKNAEDHSSASHLLRIGRRAIAEVVRKLDPSAFIYAGNGDFEQQFDEEIRRRAQQNHPWTQLKKRDIQAIDEETKGGLPKFIPVQVVNKDDQKDNMIYHGISLELCLMPPVYKKKGYFPWWFIYVAWAVAVVTILICSFVTIFYGLSIGRLRSWHWFSEISFAFIQTLLITQPVRILLVASIFSVLFRKIHASEEDRFQVVVDDGKEQLSTKRKLKLKPFQPTRSYPPLDGATLLQLRLKARRRNELKRGLVSMFFHILAMIFLASIISNSSSTKFAVTSHIRNMLHLEEGGAFASIKTSTDFYQYMNHFAQTVNPVKDYNGIPVAPVGDARYESTIMADAETMILGIPRIRQVRIKSSQCPIHERVKHLFTSQTGPLTADEEKVKDTITCHRGYDRSNEDVGTYNPFWKEVVGDSRSWKSSNDVWKWRTPEETLSIRINGRLSKYDAGGYVAELGMQYRKTISVLNYLRQTKWIDSRTRAVFVEMSAIVPNVNIFADVLLILELSPAGAYATTGRVFPMQITFPPTKGESWRTWVTVSYVGISLHTIGLILGLGRDIIYYWQHYRWGLVGHLWLWLDFAIGSSSALAIGLAVKFHLQTKSIHERLDTSLVNEFINLQSIAYWDHIHISLFAAIFGLCIIKTWRFLILFLNRFYILALTLRLTARFLLGFMLIIVILVVGFACWGVLAFGQFMESFHSIGHAFLELKHQLLQASFYKDLRDVHAVIGRFYFLLFGLCLVLVGVNLFVALLASGFFEAKEIARQRRHRETYWTALKNSRLRRFLCGIPREKKPEQKLPIPPLRLKAMENATSQFIRACIQTNGFERMKEMLAFCNQELLKGTGYFMVAKKDKKKRVRDAMNTTLAVSKERLEDMRQITIAHLRERLQLDLTKEEAQAYSKFHQKLLEIKLRKVRKVLVKLEDTMVTFLKRLDHEEAEALEAKLRAEGEKLKQSAMGWRRYLPPEVLLNTSASQHRYEPPGGGQENETIPVATSNRSNIPASPPPSLRRRNFF